MRPLSLVDAHTHVVSDDSRRYPIDTSVGADQEWHRERPVNADRMMHAADGASVRGVVFVQSLSCHGYDNRYAVDSARRFAPRTIAVGASDPTDRRAAASLRREVLDGGMRGVRLSAAGDPPSFDGREMRRIVAEAADLAVPVVLVGGVAHLSSFGRLARAFPAVLFVVDHCGFADLRNPATLAAAEPLVALADLPNVACKVTSINLQSTSDPSTLWSTLAARFGSERVLWGSDYPHSDGPGYAELVRLARATTEILGPSAQADVLGGSARRIWPSLLSESTDARAP